MDEPKTQEKTLERPAVSFFAKNRTWLNAVLFVLTVLSTFFVGLSWSVSYKYAAEISQSADFKEVLPVLRDPQILLLSVIYAAVLLAILLGHELGHYLTCRRYGIDATLPFFIPAPGLIGTLGAFIKIKSPITRKQQLFDIGVAGPLTGFFLALPALVIGLSLSKAVPALPREGTLFFGEPLLLKILGAFYFKGIGPGRDIVLHPVAFAGWVGSLVTALNLFPLGQLDGGHVAYAIFGPKVGRFSRLILIAFAVMGIFFWVGWLVWLVIILILGVKHPRIWDEQSPLGTKRTILGILVILIFLLSFVPDPIKGFSLIELVGGFRL
jgi:membrane-associated protease RseP (regulator of RpoE activity)